MRTVAIVGGGITGLSAAYFLERLSPTPIQIILFEKNQRTGGLIQTLRLNDFIIEQGPEALVSYKRIGREFCEMLGLGNDIIESKLENQKNFLLTGGKLIPFPSGILSPFSRPIAPLTASFAFTKLLPVWGKIRLLLEPLVPKRSSATDESIRHFVTRRLGTNFYCRLVEPLLSGVYGRNPGDLSAHAVLKELVGAENLYGGITKALFKTKQKKLFRGSLFFSFRNGLDQLSEKIHASLRATEIRLSHHISCVKKRNNQFEIDGISADAVILACPAYIAGKISSLFDPELAKRLSEISYTSASIAAYAFRREQIVHRLNGYGFLVSPEENLPFHACTWTTSKWDHRAPAGNVLIRTYASDLEPKDEEILNRLRQILSITGDPVLSEQFTLPQSMPFYRCGHPELIDRIKKRLKSHPNLYLAGAAYEGVGIPDCIDSAKRTVDSILAINKE